MLEVVVEVFGFAIIAVVICGILYVCIEPDAFDAVGLFCIAVDDDEDGVDFNIAGCYFEWEGHLGSEGL